MSAANLVIVVFALLSAACGARAARGPEILVDRTPCSHCGMLISEPVYAAAYQVHESEPRVFDDIGCMLDALRRETAVPAKVWVQDASSGGWLDANQAVFVTSSHLRTPMSGGMLAYADAMTAERAAAAHRGDVVRSLSDLMTRKGDAK